MRAAAAFLKSVLLLPAEPQQFLGSLAESLSDEPQISFLGNMTCCNMSVSDIFEEWAMQHSFPDSLFHIPEGNVLHWKM